LVHHVVDLENHRTLQQWNNSLTIKLSSVKLFVALFPFLHLAFGTNWFDKTCMVGVNDTVLANELFGKADTWPTLTYWNGTVMRVDGSNLTWLQPDITRLPEENTSCINGCYPSQCYMQKDGLIACTSTCMQSLLINLSTFYLTHVFTTLFLILVPVLLLRYEIKKEKASPSLCWTKTFRGFHISGGQEVSCSASSFLSMLCFFSASLSVP